jgi:hypothetical protein
MNRLAEFSPIGLLFSLGSFLKNKKSSQNFYAYFIYSKSYVLILTKSVLAYILGDFLTNSSGHPGRQ